MDGEYSGAGGNVINGQDDTRAFQQAKSKMQYQQAKMHRFGPFAYVTAETSLSKSTQLQLHTFNYVWIIGLARMKEDE